MKIRLNWNDEPIEDISSLEIFIDDDKTKFELTDFFRNEPMIQILKVSHRLSDEINVQPGSSNVIRIK